MHTSLVDVNYSHNLSKTISMTLKIFTKVLTIVFSNYSSKRIILLLTPSPADTVCQQDSVKNAAYYFKPWDQYFSS